MAQSPVGADFNKSPDVLANFPPQIPFIEVIPVDYLPNSVNLLFRQFVHPGWRIHINLGFDQNLPCHLRPNAIYTAKGYMGFFSIGYIHACYTNQCWPPEFSRILALPLSVTRVGADYPDHAFASNHTTFVASGFYRCRNFHIAYSRRWFRELEIQDVIILFQPVAAT